MFPKTVPPPGTVEPEDTLDIGVFWDAFVNGHGITPWRHRDYIRAAWISVLGENSIDKDRRMSLLEKAERFATRLHHFKQRNSQFQLLPESRLDKRRPPRLDKLVY